MIQDVIGGTALRAFDTSGFEQPQVEGSIKTEKQDVRRNFSQKVLESATKEVNKALAGLNTHVEFSVYKPTHEVVVKIKDSDTGKVIKEIPSKKDLEMAAYMRKLAGIIVDTTV